MQSDRGFLPDCPFLSSFDLKEEDVFRQHFYMGRYVTDKVHGVPAVGVVASGSIGVYSAAADGNDIELTRLYAGDCFGICNLMLEETLDTLLCCKEDTVICYVAKPLLLRQLEEDPKRALRCVALCTEKLRFLLRRIEQLTVQSSRGKLIFYLLAAADSTGELRLPGSREDLARHLGISRAALFRELAFLQGKGVLRVRSARMRIPDRRALEALLDS